MNRCRDKLLPDDGGVLLDMIDEISFSKEAAWRFRNHPELYEELLESENLLHLQMASLACAAVDAIRSSKPKLVADILSFVEGSLKQPRAISEIENAVAISFLDLAAIQEDSSLRPLLELLPEGIQAVLDRQQARWAAFEMDLNRQ